MNSQKKANDLNEQDRAQMQKRSIDLAVKFDSANAMLADLSGKVSMLS